MAWRADISSEGRVNGGMRIGRPDGHTGHMWTRRPINVVIIRGWRRTLVQVQHGVNLRGCRVAVGSVGGVVMGVVGVVVAGMMRWRRHAPVINHRCMRHDPTWSPCFRVPVQLMLVVLAESRRASRATCQKPVVELGEKLVERGMELSVQLLIQTKFIVLANLEGVHEALDLSWIQLIPAVAVSNVSETIHERHELWVSQ